MNLIAQLKEEHIQILYDFSDLVKNIKNKLLSDSDIIAILDELKILLTNHLSLEDNLLYSAFEKL